MRRSVFFATLATFALLLTACNITVTGPGPTPEPFPNAVPVDATTDPLAAETVTVPANDSIVLEVNLPSDVRANALMYFELDTTELELALYNASGTILASSTTDATFREGNLALVSVASSAIEPQVTVATTCRGTCILHETDRSQFFLEIINPTSTAQTVQVFLFSESFSDAFEPLNDALSGAVDLFGGDTAEGAIETLGDQDFWSIEQAGVLEFNTDSTLDLVMEVFRSDGSRVAIVGRDSGVDVQPGWTAVVHERENDAAGVAASSFYTIGLQ